MSKFLFDFNNQDLFFKMSDNMGIDSDGNIKLRISKHMSLDTSTGETHITSSWKKDEEEE